MDDIVQYRAGKEHQKVHGSLEVIIPGTDQVLVINVKRFMNVMFGSIIKPLIARRGQSLVRRQLEDEEKTDQGLCERIIVEYNSDKLEYGAGAFPYLESEFTQDASCFTPIPSNAW